MHAAVNIYDCIIQGLIDSKWIYFSRRACSGSTPVDGITQEASIEAKDAAWVATVLCGPRYSSKQHDSKCKNWNIQALRTELDLGFTEFTDLETGVAKLRRFVRNLPFSQTIHKIIRTSIDL